MDNLPEAEAKQLKEYFERKNPAINKLIQVFDLVITNSDVNRASFKQLTGRVSSEVIKTHYKCTDLRKLTIFITGNYELEY